MIIGIGIDCCDVRRMESMLSDGRFLRKFFTGGEQAYIQSKNASAAQSLAGHFAAKEAGLKALGCGIAHPLTEIEIAHDERGAPFYRLSGGAKERMLSMGGKKLHLSIAHTGEMAAAAAILEGGLIDCSHHSFDIPDCLFLRGTVGLRCIRRKKRGEGPARHRVMGADAQSETMLGYGMAKQPRAELAVTEPSKDCFPAAHNDGLRFTVEGYARNPMKNEIDMRGLRPSEEIGYQAEKEALLSRIIAGRFPYSVITDADVRAILPQRPFDAHKASCGHALIVAGSFGMAGAASLCVNAALHGGAGLVTAACPKEIIPIVQILAPCAMCAPVEELQGALQAKSAVAAGPGLGKSEALGQTLQTLRELPLPQVWDADALNWLSSRPERLSPAFVLTPHYGEAARLLNVPVQKITDDPAEAIFSLHMRYDAVILLKGPVTLITDGKNLAANRTGTPGMATGGSGDVLTGLIAAFLSQGASPYDAARAAAFLHGKAGEAAAARVGVRSMIAQDILNALCIE